MLEPIYQSILEGDAATASAGVEAALAAEVEPGDILNKAMIPAMAEVGRRFEAQDYFIPEMLISARAMQSGLVILKPHLVESNIESAGTVVLGTVSGDLHDIGKNLVGMMLEGAGFEVVDLGTDVSPEKFVTAAQEEGADIVAMSALLTTTMPRMATTIDALVSSGARDRLKVMVGGAPLTQQFAEQIGADLYAPDASTAARQAKALLNPN